jgi:hypothetical protein
MAFDAPHVEAAIEPTADNVATAADPGDGFGANALALVAAPPAAMAHEDAGAESAPAGRVDDEESAFINRSGVLMPEYRRPVKLIVLGRGETDIRIVPAETGPVHAGATGGALATTDDAGTGKVACGGDYESGEMTPRDSDSDGETAHATVESLRSASPRSPTKLTLGQTRGLPKRPKRRRDYRRILAEYVEQAPYREAARSGFMSGTAELACVLCKQTSAASPITRAFLPCEHACVCDSCIQRCRIGSLSQTAAAVAVACAVHTDADAGGVAEGVQSSTTLTRKRPFDHLITQAAHRADKPASRLSAAAQARALADGADAEAATRHEADDEYCWDMCPLCLAQIWVVVAAGAARPAGVARILELGWQLGSGGGAADVGLDFRRLFAVSGRKLRAWVASRSLLPPAEAAAVRPPTRCLIGVALEGMEDGLQLHGASDDSGDDAGEDGDS